MNIKASGRSALIVAAGLWLCVGGPMRATESAARAADSSTRAEDGAASSSKRDNAARRRHGRTQASTNSRKVDKDAAKAASDKKVDDADTLFDKTSILPASIADANAQLPANAPVDSRNVSTQAGNVLKTMGGQPALATVPQRPDANLQVVAADQLNELDRALGDDRPAPVLASATIDQPVMASRDNTAWDKTSMIGRIFIAFGSLLTLASAARMFMA